MPSPTSSPIVRRLSAEWTARVFRRRHASTRSRPPGPTWDDNGDHSARVSATITCAWRATTSAKYSSAVNDFTAFCSQNGIPLSECLPASERLLCAYASSFAGSLAGRSIRNKCSALRSWHISNGLPWLGATQLSYVIKGAENMRPADSLRPIRPAVTADMLRALESALDNTNPFDVCTLFVATTAFWAQLRLGELLPSAEKSFDSSCFPSWADLQPPNSAGSQVLRLPRTKTSGTSGDSVLITRQTDLDPIGRLHHHASLNGGHDGILGSYRLPDGSMRALTRQKFIARCNEILLGMGFQRISGHCFRIGGTTQLLLAGVPPDIVRLMGRWSSDSFLRYWRSLELIAPMYAELLHPILPRTGVDSPRA